MKSFHNILQEKLNESSLFEDSDEQIDSELLPGDDDQYGQYYYELRRLIKTLRQKKLKAVKKQLQGLLAQRHVDIEELKSGVAEYEKTAKVSKYGTAEENILHDFLTTHTGSYVSGHERFYTAFAFVKSQGGLSKAKKYLERYYLAPNVWAP